MDIKPFYSGRAYYDITADNGDKYVFVPQEFVQKGFIQEGQQFYNPGFLTPDVLSTASAFTLPNDSALTGAAKSIYTDPTKGFVWKADDFKKFNPDDFSIKSYQPTDKYGTIKGLTIKDGAAYYAQEPTPGSNYTLLDKDGVSNATTITVTRSGGGGGALAGLGRELIKAGPILPIALDFALPGLGTAVAGGIAAGSLAAGDEQNALRYGAQYAAGTLGAGGATEGSGALASQTAAEASSGLAGAGAGAAGSAGAGALASQLAAEGSSGTNALAAGNAGAGALAAQTAAEASSAVPLAGAGAAAGTGALAAQTAAEGSSAVPLAGAGAALPAAAAAGAGAAAAPAAAAGTASWMLPAAVVGSSLIGANAAQKAAQTQSDAAAQANQLLAQMYATQRADLAPFTAAGVGAQNKLLTYLGLPGGTAGADYGKYTKDFTGADLLAGQDPGYAFRLSEGQKALERSAAARGGLLSGGTGKALTSFGQQMGSQEYQNAYNRYQTNRANQLAPLFTLTGSGQASAAGQAAAAGNYGTGAANNLTSAGAARAAGDVGTANALTSGLGSYLNYSGQQDLLAAYNERTRQSAYRS